MIVFEDVHKRFVTPDGVVRAVTGLSFEVSAGTFFTLLGPSGCGKTTTMRMLAGLAAPDSGQIAIGGRKVFSDRDGINVPANKRDLSMVFQSYAIWPHMTVAQNVAYPLRVKKLPKNEIHERVEQVLSLVGLEGMGPRQATRLSGGQQQRVALARALVPDPQVLLLDEPLSNLDARLRAQMRIELKELQSRLGLTTIYVTHDQQEALAMSDELVVMRTGTIAQRGTPDDVYHRPRNRFTAEFIGTTNLVEGRASGSLQVGLNTLETSLGPIQARSLEAVSSDRRVFLVSMRPEVFDMHQATDSRPGVKRSDAVNVFTGTIESAVFLGDSTDCRVRIGDREFSVKNVPLKPLAPGTEVVLEIAAEHCTILVDGDESDEESALAHDPLGSDGLEDPDAREAVGGH